MKWTFFKQVPCHHCSLPVDTVDGDAVFDYYERIYCSRKCRDAYLRLFPPNPTEHIGEWHE